MGRAFARASLAGLAGAPVRTAHRADPVGVAETLRVLDSAGVGRAVLVPPSWEGDRNDLALEAAACHPDRFGVMAEFRRTDRAAVCGDAGGTSRACRAGDAAPRPGAAAFRRDGSPTWFWETASDLWGLPVMVDAPGLSGRLGVVARRCPRLRLIVDHLALPVGLTGPRRSPTCPNSLSCLISPGGGEGVGRALPLRSGVPSCSPTSTGRCASSSFEEFYAPNVLGQ